MQSAWQFSRSFAKTTEVCYGKHHIMAITQRCTGLRSEGVMHAAPITSAVFGINDLERNVLGWIRLTNIEPAFQPLYEWN
jgi:hypothetical protein